MGDFRFGIKTLDNLIVGPHGDKYGSKDRPFVGCIVGPDGVGKSILALHAASTYRAETIVEAGKESVAPPSVIYVSTDLNHDQANRTWEALSLNRPKDRLRVLEEKLPYDFEFPEAFGPKETPDPKSPIILRKIIPEFADSDIGEANGLNVLLKKNQSIRGKEVLFVDLAEHTAGDDWDFVNRILGKLASEDRPSKCPHLLIIDAIEGLEAMGDESDGYGLHRTRRSRLAQLLRLAKKASCHVMLIIEETKTDERLPEVFVSDLVIRLRSREEDGYLRRTVEIEKARGRYHVRGQHDIAIKPSSKESANHSRGRNGTKDQETHPNLDEPQIDFSYVLVTPSLDVRHRDTPTPSAVDDEQGDRSTSTNPFGIAEIDELLKATHLGATRDNRMLAVIGDSSTYKSDLGIEFLAAGFFADPDTACLLLTTTQIEWSKIKGILSDWALDPKRFSHHDASSDVVSTFNWETDARTRFIVRNIAPRYLSSAGLFHIIRANLEQLRKTKQKIRVVVDDWTILLESHPSMARDPRLLQSLVAELKQWGVFSLLIATEPGSPSTVRSSLSPHDLANLDIKKVYTWPVPFFGSRLTAVTVFPSPDLAPRIYELRKNSVTRLLEVDNRFQLYSGLEEGQAERIPLEVRLYSGNQATDISEGSRSYNARIRSLFDDLYAKVPSLAHVVQFQNIENYDDFREYVRSLDDTQLDHTLLIQIDEFWQKRVHSSHTPTSDSPVKSAMSRVHMDFGFLLADRDAWRAARDCRIVTEVIRKGGVKKERLGKDGAMQAFPNLKLPTDKSFDSVWDDSYHRSEYCTVGEVYDALCSDDQKLTMDASLEHFHPSWTTFFDACRIVGEFNGIPPFDIDMRTGETLCVSVLEIWMSVLANSLDVAAEVIDENSRNHGFEELRDQLLWLVSEDANNPPPTEWSLCDWAKRTSPCLFTAVVLLRQILPRLSWAGGKPILRKADARCAAFRTWYSTASFSQSENPRLVPLRLPGRFSVRGDWFVKAAGGSRSDILAKQAISRLASTELQIERLRDGVGLPIPRTVATISAEVGDHLDTALTVPEAEGLRRFPVTLGTIKSLGADEISSSSTICRFADRSRWLFRSKIRDYAKQTTPFMNLLGSLFVDWGFLAPMVNTWSRFDIREEEALTAAVCQHGGAEPRPDFDLFQEDEEDTSPEMEFEVALPSFPWGEWWDWFAEYIQTADYMADLEASGEDWPESEAESEAEAEAESESESEAEAEAEAEAMTDHRLSEGENEKVLKRFIEILQDFCQPADNSG